MNKKMAAYLAGLIDGEGYIGILQVKPGEKKEWHTQWPYMFVPVLKVAMCDKDLILWLYNSFGGTFEVRRGNERRLESYCWAVRKSQVRDFIKLIYPYLRSKRKQAEIILKFPKNYSGVQITKEIFEARKRAYEELKALHFNKVAR